MKEKEIWKVTDLHDGTYCVSTKGRVFRTFHHVFDGRRNLFVKCKMLKPSKTKRGCYCINVNGQLVKIHRLVAKSFLSEYSDSLMVDHIDRNPKNNNISNLRMATTAQNCMNMSAHKNTSSKFKGVSVVHGEKANKYHSYIMKDYKRINLGYFESENEAAIVYDLKSLELFGEFAVTNKMLGLYDTP